MAVYVKDCEKSAQNSDFLADFRVKKIRTLRLDVSETFRLNLFMSFETGYVV